MIDKEWIDETCGTCAFRICGYCRRRPPTTAVNLESCPNDSSYKKYRNATGKYIQVDKNLLACYDWRRREAEKQYLEV